MGAASRRGARWVVVALGQPRNFTSSGPTGVRGVEPTASVTIGIFDTSSSAPGAKRSLKEDATSGQIDQRWRLQ